MLEIIISAAVIILDQVSKILSDMWLNTLPFKTYTVIEGVFNLTYVKNTGASFGMLSGARIFFIVITLIACSLMVAFLIKEHKRLHNLMRVSVALVLSGAIGNLIDRVFLGYVRDMIEPAFVNFAVFNIADAAITIGVILLVIDVMFLKKGRRYTDELERRIESKKQERKAKKENKKSGGK